MIKRKLHLFVTGLMMVLLVACANNENNPDVSGTPGGGMQTGSISSIDTSTPSSKYPHTKAVQIQKAKYIYYKVEGGEKVTGKELRNLNEVRKEYVVPAPDHQAPSATQAPEIVQQPKATPEQTTKQPTTEQAAPTAPKETTKTPTTTATGISDIEAKVIELTNVERRKNGLSDLQGDTNLSKVAREKSMDMQKNNYFSHTSPTYGSPFDMMRDFGITYKTAAENIAQGQQSAEEVVNAWMNSEGHRANILNGKFTHIGVGYEATGKNWTQMFIGK